MSFTHSFTYTPFETLIQDIQFIQNSYKMSTKFIKVYNLDEKCEDRLKLKSNFLMNISAGHPELMT